MTIPTIRDHCAAQVNDVAYLLECIEDGSSDPITLQGIADRANSARDLLRAEPAGEVPTDKELLPVDPPIIQTTMAMQYRSAWRAGVEDGWNEARAILARWGRPATPPVPEVGELVEGLRLISDGMSALGHKSDSWFVARAATLLQQQAATTTEDLKND